MLLSRWIVPQRRLGLGLREVLRSGHKHSRNMCMVVALEEPINVPTGIPPVAQEMPLWFPSTPTRSPLAPFMPSLLGRSQVNPTAMKIDGKGIAGEIKRSLTQTVKWMKEQMGAVPGLAMVQVGDLKDSSLYVRGKQAACSHVGIKSFVTHMPESASEAEILDVIHRLNSDTRVHGIIVELPLPRHIKQENILRGVSLDKDVDGLHPVNLGRLTDLSNMEPTFVPCTPLGCLELLRHLGVDVEKKHAVVIGCSSVVGFPAALLLQKKNARVTIVQLDTPNPVETTRQADIVISATGVPRLVRGHWLKPGAIVIDVGTSAVEDPSSESGFRETGDVCYEEAERVASAITPVPGGVGPMTIAMLLSNTVKAAQRSFGLTNA